MKHKRYIAFSRHDGITGDFDTEEEAQEMARELCRWISIDYEEEYVQGYVFDVGEMLGLDPSITYPDGSQLMP